MTRGAATFCLTELKVAGLSLGLDAGACSEGDLRRLYVRHGFVEAAAQPDEGVVIMG